MSAPLALFAQPQRSTIARIGVLEGTPAASSATGPKALIKGLRELGYVEGKNISFEYRAADGKYERLPGLAAELVRMKVDVMLARGAPAVQAAQRATATIPIVMLSSSDPVASGFVASLSRPGGNITGLSNINVDVSSKYLELLRSAVPNLARVVVLVYPGNSTHSGYVKRMRATETTYRVAVLPVQASTEGDIETAFGVMKQEHAGALIVLPDSFFYAHGGRIAELAIRHRLPTMFGTREPVESGGLMSYGHNSAEEYYRAATYVHKILRGAKPGDLPVEQPTKIELVINLSTAKLLGIEIPNAMLLRADKVIE
jgi:putative ABC transport system substrate-binding protein